MFNLEDTRFIFSTNFEGNPDKDKYKSTKRQCNIVIPTVDQAMALLDLGYNVKETMPREGEEEGFQKEYYIKCLCNIDSQYPPKVYLVNEEGVAVKLDANTVNILDEIRVKNVNATISPWEWEPGKFSMYINVLYVEQSVEDDPFASKYKRTTNAIPRPGFEDEGSPEGLPFE